jgi:hypothetical protein
MSGMQQVKTAIGEHQLFPLGIQKITQAPNISGSGGRITDGHVLLMACDREDARHEHVKKQTNPRREQKSGGRNLRFLKRTSSQLAKLKSPC